MTTTNPDPDLMRIFDFTAADLESNRAGKISRLQAQRLLNIAQSQKEDTGCLKLLMLPFYLLLGCILIQQFASSDIGALIIVLIVVVLLIAAEVLELYKTYYRKHPAEEDASVGKIEVADGHLQLIIKRRAGGSAHYIDDDYLRVHDTDFPIKKSVRKQIEQFLASKSVEPNCRVYYVPKSMQILAAEIVE